MPMPKGGTKARKPTALKLVEGTLNVTRQNKDEPKVMPKVPKAPDHLDEEEKAAWKKFGSLLGPMKVCGAGDFAALESLVTCWVHSQRLRSQLRADYSAGDLKLTYECESKNGAVVEHPKAALKILGDVDRRLKDWLGRFGLTPADRSRVSSDGADQGSKDDEFA